MDIKIHKMLNKHMCSAMDQGPWSNGQEDHPYVVGQ